MNNWNFSSRRILSPPAWTWDGFLWNSMNLRSWWTGSGGGKCRYYFFKRTSERKTVAPMKQWCSVAQSCLTVSDPVDYSTPGFPLLHHLPGVCSDSRPLSWWCHPTISSVAPFCPQSFPASGSFPVSLLFASGAKVLELQHQSFQWIFRLIKQGGRANSRRRVQSHEQKK